MPKLLCFGDSITYGAWDLQGGWVARVRQKLDQRCLDSGLKDFYLTYNLGISSDTSSNLLERFDSDVASRMREEGAPLFIFSIGTNDSIKTVEDGQFWVEPATFQKNIDRLIEKAKQHSDKILFLGSLPVDETKTQPYLVDATISSRNEDIRAYELLMIEACQKTNVDCLPIFEQAIRQDYQKLLIFDGVHPNEHGHALLSEKVWRFVERSWWAR